MRKLAVLNEIDLCRYFCMDPDDDSIRITLGSRLNSDSRSGFGSEKAKMTIKKGTENEEFSC